MIEAKDVDVLCIGHACYDLVFSVPHHPGVDEKLFASSLYEGGGGPAANAAIAVARLGYRAAFSGYLGNDIYGQLHAAEFEVDGVDTSLLARGDSATAIAVVLVKPNGDRALVSFKEERELLPSHAADFSVINPLVVLMDGHELNLSKSILSRDCIKVLDAGSLHAGTEALMFEVDFLVCSEKFAREWFGKNDPYGARDTLAQKSPNVIITLGDRGLLWRRGSEFGSLPAYPVTPVDTTGAGDAFHGAFAAGLSAKLSWFDLLSYASGAGAQCCEVMGARQGIPYRHALSEFINLHGILV